MKKNKKGFTLVELMIGVAIITIIAMILIPNYIRAQHQSKLSGCEQNEKNIATLLETYAVDNLAYPSAGGNIDDGTAIGTALSPYTKKFPRCPAGNTIYQYDPPGGAGGVTYVISCGGLNTHTYLNVPSGYPQYYGASGIRKTP